MDQAFTMESLRLVPEAASEWARQADYLIWALTALSTLFVVLVSGVTVYFCFRYHAGSKANRELKSPDNTALELTWSIAPTFLALGFFVWSAYLYLDSQRIPEGALEIQVVGKQWMWKLQHPNGRREVNELHIPKDQPIKLVMTSQDVIHSFFVPALRSKLDVLPDRYSVLSFTPDKAGKYRLFCAEYCGTEHSRMGGWVHVMEPHEYQEWLGSGNQTLAAATPEAAGEKLFAKLGCVTCHDQGAASRGPQLAGRFGKDQPLQSGDAVLMNEEYIRESILYPQKKLVAGYPPLMPTYKGQVREEDILSLIAYIKSLADQKGVS